MRKLITLSLLFFGSAALAAGGGHGEGHGVPAGTVISQIVNLGLLVAILYFWQGKAIAKAFKDKKDNFIKSVEDATKSKTDAQAKVNEVQKRVNDLKSTYQEQIAEAKKNSEESYRVQLADAKNEATRIKDMALGSLESEVQKEIESLRLETYKKSAGMAQENLGKNLSSDQQKAWNTHFASEVKGVH